MSINLDVNFDTKLLLSHDNVQSMTLIFYSPDPVCDVSNEDRFKKQTYFMIGPNMNQLSSETLLSVNSLVGVQCSLGYTAEQSVPQYFGCDSNLKLFEFPDDFNCKGN